MHVYYSSEDVKVVQGKEPTTCETPPVRRRQSKKAKPDPKPVKKPKTVESLAARIRRSTG